MLKPRRSAVAFAAAFLAAQGALALEGRYIARDKANRQELEIKKRADGGFDLTAVVEAEGCSGYVDALGEACPGSEVQNAPNRASAELPFLQRSRLLLVNWRSELRRS
jgi:hypothetical protein